MTLLYHPAPAIVKIVVHEFLQARERASSSAKYDEHSIERKLAHACVDVKNIHLSLGWLFTLENPALRSTRGRSVGLTASEEEST